MPRSIRSTIPRGRALLLVCVLLPASGPLAAGAADGGQSLLVPFPRIGDEGVENVTFPAWVQGSFRVITVEVAIAVGGPARKMDGFGVERDVYPIHRDMSCSDPWCVDTTLWVEAGSQLVVRAEHRDVAVPLASTALPDPLRMIRDEEPYEIVELGPRSIAPYSLVGRTLTPGETLAIEDAPPPIDIPPLRYEVEVLPWSADGTLPVRRTKVLDAHLGLTLTETDHFDAEHALPLHTHWRLVGPDPLVPGGALEGSSRLTAWTPGEGPALAGDPTPPLATRRAGAAYLPWSDEGPKEPAANGYTLTNAIRALRADARAASFFAAHPQPTFVGATTTSIVPLVGAASDEWRVTLGEPGGTARLHATVEGRQIGDLVLTEEITSVRYGSSWLPAPPAGAFEGRDLACLTGARDALAESLEGRELAPPPYALFQNAHVIALPGGFDVQCDAFAAIIPPHVEARADERETRLAARYAAAVIFGERGAHVIEFYSRQTVVVGEPGSG